MQLVLNVTSPSEFGGKMGSWVSSGCKVKKEQ